MKAERQQASVDGARESFFIPKHTEAAAEQKQAVKMNFHILKDLIYMPAFLAQPNFFPLRL